MASGTEAKTLASENVLEWAQKDKRRFLHAVYRVGDLDRTIKFYTECFGMQLLRKRDIPEEKYSNAFLGFGPEDSHFVVELTYNYGVDKYDIGTGFGHFAIATEDVYKLVENVREKGGKVTREPGPVKGGTTVIAFVQDPDGYLFGLIQRGPTPEPLCQVMLRVGDLERSIKFYEKACGMKLLRKKDVPQYKYTIAMMGYADEYETTVLELAYNYGVTEYTKGNAYAQEDESALLRFLQCKFGKGRSSGPEFFYDPKYALRLCLKEKRMRACVHIYSMMSMHEEAVSLALQVDPELAMAEADKVEDDEDLRKKLWLMVAKHVIEQEKGVKRENIRKAIAFLKETDGLLKIEDILPFFPDFALIDDFKEAICTSLEDYNKQIEQLKQEMNDATHGADNIRNDISALAQRFAVIDRDAECGGCKRKILTSGGTQRLARGYTSVGPMAPFYVFPCGHTFHAQCLIAHVTRCTSRTQAEYILDLQKQLSLLGDRATKELNGSANGESVTSMTPIDKLRSQLDDAIASECPFCGELMIQEISLPFILPEEADQMASWEIKPQVATQKILPMSI